MASSDYYVADNSDIDNKKLEAAKNHYSNGDYTSALRLYLSLLNTDTSYRLYHRIAKCYYKMGNFTQAKEYFTKSTEMEKSENPSFLYLGNISYKNNDLKHAIYYWCKAFAYKPEDENVCLNLASSYFSKNMNFQSVFYYEKFLKYADKNGQSYSAIKTSIDKCKQLSKESFQKAKAALLKKNTRTAKEFLNIATTNMPTNFDMNYALGTTYLAEGDNMHALVYLKQALCIDNKSLDVLEKLATVNFNLGDYTSAFCAVKRILPLVINNQQEYLKTMKLVKELGATFDKYSYLAHRDWGNMYFDNNNYHLALIEYENCTLLNEKMIDELEEKIEMLKLFINPETKVLQSCLKKGEKLYAEKDYKNANKYFSRVMTLSDSNSPEYRTAKTRIVNV